LRNKEFQQIYDEASDTLKKIGTYDQMNKLLSFVYEVGNLEKYKVIKQNFEPAADGGYVDVIFEMIDNNIHSYLSLAYMYDRNEYKLSGFNYNKQ
jgi:hypothetical protein